MEWTERNRLYESDDAVRGHSGVVPFSTEEATSYSPGEHSRIISTLKRKSGSYDFLVWVAFTRDKDLNISEPQRRECPLIGCERTFKDSAAMLQHFPKCLLHSKGTYRCFNCGEEERIGKYHRKTCPDPEQCNDRFVKLANSVRLVKRFLSRQKLRQQHSPRSKSIDVPHPDCAELAFDPSYELGTDYFDGPAEMSGESMPSELGNLDDSVLEQMSPSELSAGTDSTLESIHYVAPQYATAELDASAHSMDNSEDLPGQASTWIPPYDHVHDNERQWHAQVPTASRPLQLNTSNVHQDLHQTPETGAASETYRRTTTDDAVSPMSPTSYEYPYTNTPALSPGESSSGTDELSSTVSSISARNTPMSSFDLSNTSSDGYKHSWAPSFGGYGTKTFCPEPEEFDSCPITGETSKAFATENDLQWSPLLNDLISNEDVTSPLPAPLFSGFPESQNFVQHLPRGATAADMIQLEHYFSPQMLSLGSGHHYLAQTSTTPLPFLPVSKYKCICGFEPTGKEGNKHSNLKRHQRTACKWLAGNLKKHKCNHPGCRKAYPRSDNLRQHQKKQNHGDSVDLQVQFSATETSGSESERDTFDRDDSEVGPKRRRMK